MCARVDYSILARTSPALTWPVLPFLTKDGSVKSMMIVGMGCREMIPPLKIGSVGECRFNEEKGWPGVQMDGR